MTDLGFIPLEQRVRACSLASRYCALRVHTYEVQTTREAEPREVELCTWHGRLWPRKGATAKERRHLEKRRMANLEAQGFQPATHGRSFGQGTGWKGHTLEV